MAARAAARAAEPAEAWAAGADWSDRAIKRIERAIEERKPVLSNIEPTSNDDGQPQKMDAQHSEIARLKAERDALKTELHIAVGLLSTQPDYSAKHPMDVLQIVKDAALDAAKEKP
jgi:hypothetical protein